MALNGVVKDACHRPTGVVPPREQVPEAMRERQHPLSYGHVQQRVVDEMGRALGHAAAAATRTEAAAFARKSDESFGAAVSTAEAAEAAGEEPAAQEPAELLVDETGQLVAVALTGRFGAERLDVIRTTA